MSTGGWTDELGPLPVETPATVAELCEIVQEAQRTSRPLYPLGGGTMLHFGSRAQRPGCLVSMAQLDRIVDFPARDMTVTVQAGIRLADLADTLARENLRLPVDVPQAASATLGGAIATNQSGPRRLGYGTFRDYVIGITAVNDRGAEYKAGGRVVKNVAGYDLCKLLVGSLGTLGIISQVTLKLRPCAEEQAVVCLGVEAPGPVLDLLHRSRTRPVCVDLLNQAAVELVGAAAELRPTRMPWTVLVGYEGNAEAVHWQVTQLVLEVGSQNHLEARLGHPSVPLWQALVENTNPTQAGVVFKATMRPSAVAPFCQAAAALGPSPRLHAHAESGIVRGHWGAELTQAAAAAQLERWRAQAQPGAVVVERCPAEWKRDLDVWGEVQAVWLMQAIKNKFDPRRIFNPGRYAGGI